MAKLDDILEQYKSHPDFVGIELSCVNQQGAVDDTPFHIAVRKGNLEDVKRMLKLGAKINMPGDLGNTPLHYAALTGQAEVAEFLVNKKANTQIENEFGETPLDVANIGGKKNVIAILK